MIPPLLITLLTPFQSLFRRPSWIKFQILLAGAILLSGKRTVTQALRVTGRSTDNRFALYHHVLSRAVWSPLQAAQKLLFTLLKFLDDGKQPLVFGIDETIERRWGAKIKARGIYRDAVRSSSSHFVKTSGLRWIALMWLTQIPWASCIWAPPFLTALAPSKRYYESEKRCHKKLTDWARQIVFQLRRWLPNRYLVVVADYSYAVLEFLAACQELSNPVTIITRLRLDAALYQPAPPYSGIGRPCKKGERLPTLANILHNPNTQWQNVTLDWYNGQQREMQIISQSTVWYHTGKPPVPIRWVLIRDPHSSYEPIALLSTDTTLCPNQIANWYVRRWRMEVTFEEVRAHLGVETQRQWSDKAIARTTPMLFGLFSWITLAAHLLVQQNQVEVRQAAWYQKSLATFSDAIGWVRHHFWSAEADVTFSQVNQNDQMVKISSAFLQRLIDTVCYTA